MTEFKMPSLGADMEAGTLTDWLVKPGDKVKRGDIIATVETQKGLIDIEVFHEGIINKLVVKVGEKVPVGTVLAYIQTPGEKSDIAAEKKTVKPTPGTKKEKIFENISISTTHPGPRIKASPLARSIAAERGINLASVKGSGEAGAITKEDVENAVTQKVAPKEEIKTTASENIRMAVAAAMSKSNREIPHYYLETKVDMTKALAWLEEANRQKTVRERLLPVVLLIKAVAKALLEIPQLNGYWEHGLRLKKEINIGFVIALRTGGVMIPAIHNADAKTLDEIMAALNDIIPRARAMKLRSSELSESTFTITSLGEHNAETVFGVIYPPQVGIIGFGAITEQPWAESGMLDVRQVVHITLSADHRATDGATGSRFLMAVRNNLQKPEML